MMMIQVMITLQLVGMISCTIIISYHDYYIRSVPSQRNQELNHPVLPQQPRNNRRSKRLTIGEETGQKEQLISDGSDFVSGYSDDSDHMSQGDDTGLVAEVS